MRERGREETCVQERMERGGGRAGTGASRTRRRYEEQKRIPPYIADVARHEEPLPNFHESVLYVRVQLEEGRRCN